MSPESGKKPVHDVWQLHEAKARFSELFRRARTHGAQRVVKRGGDAVVVIPAEEFDHLKERARQPERLVDFFRRAPLGGKPLDLKRKRDVTRRIDW